MAVAVGSGVLVAVAVDVPVAVLVAVGRIVAVGVVDGIVVAVTVAVGAVMVKVPLTDVTGNDCAAVPARIACVKDKGVLPLALAAVVYEIVRIAPVPGTMVRLPKL